MNIDVEYIQEENAFFVCWKDDIISSSSDLEISTWCHKNFEDKDWINGVSDFSYLWTKSHRDVVLFSLRWS